MKSFKKFRLLRTWLVAALLATPFALQTSCVDDPGLINRTGADKIDKRLFEGVWLYVATTVDAPYSTALSFTGHTNFGDAAKVVFDIQESWLVAYPVVEAVEGSEKGFKTNKIRRYWDPDNRDKFIDLFVGQPLARWPIAAHFDVNRKYNSYNGAQSNELVENTSDRPWFQRDYIRVHCASQAIHGFFYGLKGSAGTHSYLVSEDKAGEPDSMTLDREGGYFDYVIRTNVRSTGANYCSIFGLSQYDCAPAEVKVRHAFRRLDPKRDYEPVRYHNNEHQDKFGYFLTERYAYDLDWGPTYEGKVYFANRWNLWLQNYDYIKPTDEEGNELTVECMTDSECDRDNGQRCQKTAGWFDAGYCAVPSPRSYTDRVLKPVIYHVNTTWHPDYMDEAFMAADSFNESFKDAVAWRLFYEEVGFGSVRGCKSHDDCKTDSLLADVDVAVREKGAPCHTDGECLAAGASCGGEGFCVTERTCNAAEKDADGNVTKAAKPCALGQTCQAGSCKDADGNTAVVRNPSLSVNGSSVIYHGSGTLVTRDVFPNSLLGQFSSNPAGTYVRFIHADPEGGAMGLQVGGTTIDGGDYDEARDYDPTDPASASFISVVPSGSSK